MISQILDCRDVVGIEGPHEIAEVEQARLELIPMARPDVRIIAPKGHSLPKSRVRIKCLDRSHDHRLDKFVRHEDEAGEVRVRRFVEHLEVNPQRVPSIYSRGGCSRSSPVGTVHEYLERFAGRWGVDYPTLGASFGERDLFMGSGMLSRLLITIPLVVKCALLISGRRTPASNA